jgi:hypothetical protein
LISFLLDKAPVGKKVEIPNVKTLGLSGDIQFLDIFELRGIENLRFLYTGWHSNQMSASIPTNLTGLLLASVSFSRHSSLVSRPQYLPALKSLELQDVVFDSPVRNYLYCPKLMDLSYQSSKEIPISGRWAEKKHHYEDSVQQLFDDCFFRETPDLESIRFRGLTMNSDLVGILQSCSLLHTLIAEDCRMKNFIPLFSKAIAQMSRFPSLKNIKIDDSWPVKFNMSYEEFTKLCSSKRPQIWISGNGRIGRRSRPIFIYRDDPNRWFNERLNAGIDSSMNSDTEFDFEAGFDPLLDMHLDIISDSD